jgi:hypothetical protein
LQAIGWTLFAMAFVLGVIWLCNGYFCSRPHALLPIAFFANLTLHVSVSQYEVSIKSTFASSSSIDTTATPSKSSKPVASEWVYSTFQFTPTPTLMERLQGYFWMAFFSHAFHGGPWVGCFFPFAIFSLPYAVLLTAVILTVYHFKTRAEFDGSREWMWMRRVIIYAFDKTNRVFNWQTSFPPKAELDNKRVIFAGHPHGILPIS